MSLQELAGPLLHLKLGIREGHGFGFLRNPLIIVAGTGGINLETEVVPPSPTPLFHNDLVWETDKINLRRFRASNTPIKLECFTIGPNNQRDCIGSILLNIKSAQVVLHGSQENVSEKWHKLIGVPPEAKALQPELLLSLTIQDPNILSQPLCYKSWDCGEPSGSLPIAKNSVTKRVSSMQKPVASSHSASDLLPDPKEGYVQLGSENVCADTFLLSISVRKAHEIELLLQSNQDLATVDNNVDPFHISFLIMGQCLKTKSFGCNNAQKDLTLNEEVVLPLRSSLSVLHSYLQENPSSTVRVLYCGQEIAAAELHMRSLVPTNDIQSFTREFCGESGFTQNCALVSSSSGSVPFQDGRQPSIELITKLKFTASPKLPSITQNKQKFDVSIPTIMSGQGLEDQFPRSDSRQSQDTFIVTNQSGPTWVPVAPGLSQSHPSNSKDCTGKNEALIEYKENSNSCEVTSKINLHNMILFVPPKTATVRFLFNCPKSSISTSAFSDTQVARVNEPILLEGICAKISGKSVHGIQIHVFEVGQNSSSTSHFANAFINTNEVNLTGQMGSSVSVALKSSTKDQIVGNLTVTFTSEEVRHQIPCGTAPTLSNHSRQSLTKNDDSCNEVFCTNSTSEVKKVQQTTSIENLSQNVVHQHFIGPVPAPSVPSTVPLMFTNSLGIPTLPTQTHTPVTPKIPLDAGTAFKIVEELEDWKEKQQEIFLAELKKKELEHISRITDEWTNQTKAQNLELERNKEECKALAEALSNAKKDLADRLKSCSKREQELQEKEKELNAQYNMKLQEFTLATKMLDERVKQQICLLETKCSNLEERLKEMQSENNNLRHQFCKTPPVSKPLGDGQTCGLSHSQVAGLTSQVDQLEKKLHASLHSNAFFKEQWGRAVREMNQAKHQFSRNAEISSDKGIENLLRKEETELQEDQKALEQLRLNLSNLNCR